jgi:hypothetical protein
MNMSDCVSQGHPACPGTPRRHGRTGAPCPIR